jgi:hypothetical protein
MNASPSRELDSDEPKQASSVATPVAVPSLGGSSDSQPLTLESPDLFINRELSLQHHNAAACEALKSWSSRGELTLVPKGPSTTLGRRSKSRHVSG